MHKSHVFIILAAVAFLATAAPAQSIHEAVNAAIQEPNVTLRLAAFQALDANPELIHGNDIARVRVCIYRLSPVVAGNAAAERIDSIAADVARCRDANGPDIYALRGMRAMLNLQFVDANAGLVEANSLLPTWNWTHPYLWGMAAKAAPTADAGLVYVRATASSSQTSAITAVIARADANAATALECAKVVTDPATGLQLLTLLTPKNDACQLAYNVRGAQAVLNAFKLWLRQQHGQTEANTLNAAAEQLMNGGQERPFIVSPAALAAAAQLQQATLKNLLVPLLVGDYPTAASFAFATAKAQTADAEYIKWIAATTTCIRIADQCWNGRAIQFVQWIRGELGANPVQDLVK